MAAIASQAHADFIWQGDTEGIKTNVDWQTAANWKAEGSTWSGTGTGPGTTNSNMWDTIVLENVTFGSETSRSVALEGWAAKFKLDSAQLYAKMGKYQAINGAYSKLEVYNNSVLDFKLGSGSFQGSDNTLIIGAGSSITFRDMQNAGSTADFNVSMTGAGAYLNFIAKEGSSINHTGAITINAYAENVDSSVAWRKFELGLLAQGVTLSNLTINLGEGWELSDVAITEDNYKGYSKCYSVEQTADGKYWVTYANEYTVADLEWQGGALTWGTETEFSGGATYSAYDNVAFTTQNADVTLESAVFTTRLTVAEGITVSLDGRDYQLTSTKGIDAKGTLELSNIVVDAASVAGQLKLGEGAKLFVRQIDNSTSFSSDAGSKAEIILNGDYVFTNQFAAYKSDVVVTDGTVVYIGNAANVDGGGTSNFNVGRVIIQNGGVVWTHTAQQTITSNWDLMSGAVLGNKDKDKEYSGNIRFNIVDPYAETAEYNSTGRVTLKQYWHKNVHLSGLLSGDGIVELLHAEKEANPVYKISHADNTFQGHFALKDGTWRGNANDARNVTLELANATAAQYATIDLATTTAKSILQVDQDSTIKALTSAAEKNTIKAGSTTPVTLTVTDGSTGFKGIIESNVTLNLTGGSFKINGAITNNGTINVRGSSTVLNLDTTGNQNAGRVFLDGGKILSENGNGDNRDKTIEHLSGSGEIEGSNWNVIWNIRELAGDGDITWKNNGTHWAPSVLNINGGTFTGTLTADRAIGYNKDNRGDYQSVLQINEGGAKTLAGAVVNLKGNGADAYMQMALNTAEVSIGGLEGTQYSHIYAGSAGIDGGNQNKFCLTKANSTGTSVLKLASDENHTYAGSVGAGISLEKSGAGKQTFSGDMSAFNGSIMAVAGELAFTATEALSVDNLSVANVGTITVANGDAAGRLSASGAVTLAGGATINAAVVDLSGASSVSFDVASGAIALNGALTMSSTEAFVAALGDSLAALSAGDILIVFTGVSCFTVGEVTYDASNALTNVDLRDWGADAAVGQYTLTYDTSANVGSIVITVGEVIPEPASATLSLAALMMLCARRRRK